MKAAERGRKLLLGVVLLSAGLAIADSIDVEILKDLEFFSNLELVEFSAFAAELEKVRAEQGKDIEGSKQTMKEAHREKR